MATETHATEHAASTYRLQIITPQGKIFDDQITSLLAMGVEGSLGVLARHTPMVVLLKEGPLKVSTQGKDQLFQLSKGIMEVNGNNEVLVLAGTAKTA